MGGTQTSYKQQCWDKMGCYSYTIPSSKYQRDQGFECKKMKTYKYYKESRVNVSNLGIRKFSYDLNPQEIKYRTNKLDSMFLIAYKKVE